MGRFLMISHAPAVSIRTRTGELSRALAAQGHDVEMYVRNTQGPGLGPAGKLAWHAREALGGIRRRPLGPGLAAVTVPTLHRGQRLAGAVERLAARRLMRRGYDAVVSAAYGGLEPPPRSGPRYVFDLVDDHAAGYRHAGQPEVAERVQAYLDRQMQRADVVTVSAHVLADLARERYGREAHLVFNGADVAAVRAAVPGSPVAAGGAPRIGYVGGLDRFVRIDLVVRAMERLRGGGVPAELTVVGRGPAVEGWDVPAWVDLKGFRPPAEIPALLNAFRVGVVPFELSPFTDAALPLKVLEYGAARQAVVSSPLEELKRHNFPWVVLAPLDPSAWADALAQALEMTWDPAWDAIVDQFDWSVSARRLAEAAGVAAPALAAV